MVLSWKNFQRIQKLQYSNLRSQILKEQQSLTRVIIITRLEVSLPMRLLISLQVQLLSELPSHLEILQHICLNLSRMMDWYSGIILTDTLFLSGDRGIIHIPVSYTHLRAHETVLDLVCRLL